MSDQDWNTRNFERAMDSVRERSERLATPDGINAELLAGCKWFLEQLTEGTLVRDVSRDAAPDWAMRMMEFVTRLNRINAAVQAVQEREP